MAEPLIMVFTADGTVEFTRSPKLYEFFNGEGAMERVSEIEKDLKLSRYYIKWLMGPLAGKNHTRLHDMQWLSYADLTKSDIDYTGDVNDVRTFSTYEKAVEHEVRVLNAMRKGGVTFG